MKVSDQFILRDIAGEHLLVPVGAAASRFNGLITMNELGRLIFTELREERTEEELADRVCSEYAVDRATALADIREYLDQLRAVGALMETP